MAINGFKFAPLAIDCFVQCRPAKVSRPMFPRALAGRPILAAYAASTFPKGQVETIENLSDYKLSLPHGKALMLYRPLNMNEAAEFNTQKLLWETAAKLFRFRNDGGPTLKVVNGGVFEMPNTRHVARFKSTEAAKRILRAAGFRFNPRRKGFRA